MCKYSIRFFIVMISFIGGSVVAQQPSLNWVRHLGASGQGLMGVSMAIDSNKSVIVAGLFRGTVDFDEGPGVFNITSNGDQDFFVTEYDSAGNFHWAKNIGGALGDQIKEMKLDQKGNIILMGMFQGTVDMDPGVGVVNATAIGSDAFVIKLDNNGNYIWSKQWQVYSINTMEIDINNNILLGGDFGGPADFDPGIGIYTLTAGNLYSDLFICKIDENGNFKWAKQMPNQSSAQLQELSMESDSKGNIFLGGNFTESMDFDPGIGVTILTSNGDADGFVVKLDSNGIFSWAKQLGGSGTDRIWSVELDNTDRVLLTGQYHGTVDFDPGPNTYDLSNPTYRGCFIVKLENDGAFVFAKTFNGEAFGECIVTDAQNNIYISGGFYNTVDFDPGIADHTLTDGNIFITKLNDSGNFVWCAQFQNAIIGSYESIYCKIKVDAIKNIYYTGMFPFAVDFDPSTSTSIIAPYGTTDAPIVKLNGGSCQTLINNINISVCDSFVLNNTTYSTSGNYTQTLMNELGCDSIINIQLTVFPKSLTHLGHDTTICSGESIVLLPGNYNQYLWNDGSTQNNLVVTDTGTYWVQVTDNNLCEQRDSITIVGAANCNKDVCEITFETKFYPNPVVANLIINKNSTDCTVKLNLYNALGQLLLRELPLHDGVNIINLNKLPSGIYFYKMYVGEKILKSGKFIKVTQ